MQAITDRRQRPRVRANGEINDAGKFTVIEMQPVQ